MDLKRPITIEEQIDALIDHGINIRNKEFARDTLSKIGYYRFSGYLIQFRKSENDSDLCRTVDFEEICKIYSFDEELRNFLRKYIEIEEVFYKSLIANTFSMIKCKKSPFDQHYHKDNYYLKEDIEDLLNRFEKNKKYYVGSPVLEHHNKCYNGKFPLWVIMEMLTLSDASKYYSCLYYSEQNAIAELVNTKSDILVNHLHCISVLRNKCAHAARLYNTNFNPPAKLGTKFLKNNPTVKNNSLFAYAIVLVKRLPDAERKEEFINGLYKIINDNYEYIDLDLIGFPENWEKVLKSVCTEN